MMAAADSDIIVVVVAKEGVVVDLQKDNLVVNYQENPSTGFITHEEGCDLIIMGGDR
jgi:predicted secreted protein